MNPEEQGLKPFFVAAGGPPGRGLRDESRRTRIETADRPGCHASGYAPRVSEMNPEEQGLKQQYILKELL